MPRGLGVGTAVGQRVRAIHGPASGFPLKGLHGEQEMGRMGRRGFGVGMETGLQHAHMGAVMDPNVADTVPQTCGADDDDSRYYDVY